MVSEINGTTNHQVPVAKSTNATQVKQKPVDSDGDNDGSKPGEVENKPIAGSRLGSIINIKA